MAYRLYQAKLEAITPVAAVATSALEGMLAVKEAAGFIKTMSETAESVGEFILKAASYAAAADTVTGAQLGLNAAMTASPVGWMAVGVSALVGSSCVVGLKYRRAIRYGYSD